MSYTTDYMTLTLISLKPYPHVNKHFFIFFLSSGLSSTGKLGLSSPKMNSLENSFRDEDTWKLLFSVDV